MRGHRLVVSSVLLVVPFARGGVVATRPGVSRVQFRLVAEPGDTAPSDALTDPDADHGTIPVLRAVLLDERAVADARAGTDNLGDRTVELSLTGDGGRQIHQITADHLRRRLAIVVDGRVIMAATINTAIGRELMISRGDGFTPAEQAAVVSAIRAAVGDAPATRP